MNDVQNCLRSRSRFCGRIVGCFSLLLAFVVDCSGNRIALGAPTEESVITVPNPHELPPRISAARIPLGITGDYKPSAALLPGGDLLLVMFHGVDLSAALAFAVTSPWPALADDANAPEPTELAAARREAQQRCRRLIYNDDGCGPLGSPSGNTADGFLYGPHSRMGALIGSQVDSVFICSGATHVLTHPTDVAESYADVAKRYDIGGEWESYRVNMRALEVLKTDAIQLTIDHCRKHELEVFYSHRINDIHNTFPEVERSTWFREHPQCCMWKPDEAAKAGGANSPKHWWSASNMWHAGVDGIVTFNIFPAAGRPDIIATADDGSRRMQGANELRWWRNEGRR